MSEDSSRTPRWAWPGRCILRPARPPTTCWKSVAEGTSLVVPALWPFEVANSLLVLFRRKKILAAERDRALGALARLPLVVDDEGPRLALGRISGTGRRTWSVGV